MAVKVAGVLVEDTLEDMQRIAQQKQKEAELLAQQEKKKQQDKRQQLAMAAAGMMQAAASKLWPAITVVAFLAHPPTSSHRNYPLPLLPLPHSLSRVATDLARSLHCICLSFFNHPMFCVVQVGFIPPLLP